MAATVDVVFEAVDDRAAEVLRRIEAAKSFGDLEAVFGYAMKTAKVDPALLVSPPLNKSRKLPKMSGRFKRTKLYVYQTIRTRQTTSMFGERLVHEPKTGDIIVSVTDQPDKYGDIPEPSYSYWPHGSKSKTISSAKHPDQILELLLNSSPSSTRVELLAKSEVNEDIPERAKKESPQPKTQSETIQNQFDAIKAALDAGKTLWLQTQTIKQELTPETVRVSPSGENIQVHSRNRKGRKIWDAIIGDELQHVLNQAGYRGPLYPERPDSPEEDDDDMREAWQIPLSELEHEDDRADHRRLVERAIKEGQPVPPEVLKDYPDLAGEAPEFDAIPNKAKDYFGSVIDKVRQYEKDLERGRNMDANLGGEGRHLSEIVAANGQSIRKVVGDYFGRLDRITDPEKRELAKRYVESLGGIPEDFDDRPDSDWIEHDKRLQDLFGGTEDKKPWELTFDQFRASRSDLGDTEKAMRTYKAILSNNLENIVRAVAVDKTMDRGRAMDILRTAGYNVQNPDDFFSEKRIRLTMAEVIGRLESNGIDPVRDYEAARKFLNKSFQKKQLPGYDDTPKKDRVEKALQFAVAKAARDMDAWELPLWAYATREFIRNARTEAAIMTGALWIPEGDFRDKHRAAVEAALKEGKPVPEDVLAEFPDLQKKSAFESAFTDPHGISREKKTGEFAGLPNPYAFGQDGKAKSGAGKGGKGKTPPPPPKPPKKTESGNQGGDSKPSGGGKKATPPPQPPPPPPPPKPKTQKDNIRRGVSAIRDAMQNNEVEPHGMFREAVGWIALAAAGPLLGGRAGGRMIADIANVLGRGAVKAIRDHKNGKQTRDIEHDGQTARLESDKPKDGEKRKWRFADFFRKNKDRKDGAAMESAYGLDTDWMVFEDAVEGIPNVAEVERTVKSAKTLSDISTLFINLFALKPNEVPGGGGPKSATEYADDDTPFGLIKGGLKTRRKINDKCKEILERVNRPEDLTTEDRRMLKQYSGEGGLQRNDGGVGAFFEYYTTTPVAEGVWGAMKAHGFENGNILEPATGAGVFLATKPPGVKMTGSEISPFSSKVAALLHPEDRVRNQSFEELVVNTPDDFFDGCITNVPFGDTRGRTQHHDPEFKGIKYLDQYFILRLLHKIKPGGLACIVCPESTVGRESKSGRYPEWRTKISKVAEFLGAHKFPTGTFAKTGTTAVIDVAVFRKHPKDLLDRIHEIPIETLREANVVWDEFIQGRYWRGEGKRFIMGKYIPAGLHPETGKKMRSKVKGNVDDAGMKKSLARKFKSRIDWELLESAEPIVRNYAEGDHRIINGRDHVYQGGVWNPVGVDESDMDAPLDEAKFGAASVRELMGLFEGGPKAFMGLTAKQAFAAAKEFPDKVPALMKASAEFAMSQPKPEIAEQLYRGSVVGGMLARLQNLKDDPDTYDSERVGLAELVVSEIDKYGHPKNNKKLTLTGESSKMFGLFANAVDLKGNLSDLLAGTLKETTGGVQFDSTNVHAIVEHLFVRMGLQSIQLEDVLALYTGPENIQGLGDIAHVDGIAIDPDGFVMPMSRFTAGDVYPRMDSLREHIGREKDERLKAKFQRQIEAIEAKRPRTDPMDITFNFQQKWYPPGKLIEFLKQKGYAQKFGGIAYGRTETVREEDPHSGAIVEKEKAVGYDHRVPGGRFYVKNRGSGFELRLADYIAGKRVSGKDQEEIQAFREQMDNLEEEFGNWMRMQPDADELIDSYDRRFNGFLPVEYEGHDLEIDVSENFTLHHYQNEAIRKLSEEGRGCLAFDVGLGKTITALGLCKYDQKMGRSKKTCIVVPKAVLGNWYQESKEFLGHHDDVLFVGFEPKRNKNGIIQQAPVYDEQGNQKTGHDGKPKFQDILKSDSPDEVYTKMWQIPVSNLPIVVMTKEKFESIPMKPDTVNAYGDKMVNRKLIKEKELEGAKGKAKSAYESGRDELRADGKYTDTGKAKKKELPFFEDMGFSSVIVDEAHEFKSLFTPEAETGIAYLSQGLTSKRALDMALKMDHLRNDNNGRGAYQLTATPVTNSPFELYNMLSYMVGLEALDEFGINNVDDFIRQFGKVENRVKIKLDGTVNESKATLIGFQNLSALRSLFKKYIHMRTAADFPEQLKLPPHEEIREDVDLSPDQESVYDDLKSDAKEALRKRASGTILSILRKMDRVTTDMDLYNEQVTFLFPAEKRKNVDALIAEIPKSVKVKKRAPSDPENPDEGEKMITVTVAFDHYEKIDGDVYRLVVPDVFESAVVNRLTEHGIAVDEVTHPLTPKYARLMENLAKHYESRDGKQIVFTEEKTQHDKLSRIIAHNLPAVRDQIGIINADTANGEKLQAISDAYNGGRLRIVICNKKAEVGVNLQKGTTAIHHLTFPWTPASIQQRNGRGIRQGNKAENIDVFYYQGKGSIDGYRLDLLKGKSNWQREMFFGTGEEMENANALGGDDFAIMLADNPEEARQKIQELKEKQIAKQEERRKKAAFNTLQMLQSQRDRLSGLDDEKQQKKDNLQADLDTAKRLLDEAVERMADPNATEKQRAAAKSRVVPRTEKMEKAKSALSRIDAFYKRKREDLESSIKMNKSNLEGQARKGTLPFDKSLIDATEGAVVDLKGGGRVVKIGTCYEYHDEKNPTFNKGDIVRIAEVDRKTQEVRVEYVVGGGGYQRQKWFDVPDVLKGDPAEVSLSEDEIAERKMMAQSWTYQGLVQAVKEGTLTEEFFRKNAARFNLTSSSYDKFLVRGPEGGGIEAVSRLDDPTAIIFPRPDDESFRADFAKAFLAEKRRGGSSLANTFMGIGHLMFGKEGLQELSDKYGANISEADAYAKIEKVWPDIFDESEHDTPEYALTEFRGYNRVLLEEKIYKQTDMAEYDNFNEAKQWINQFCEAKKGRYEEALRAEEAENERRKLEEIRNHPDYKEVPKPIYDAFKELGITVKTNTTNMTIPGYRNIKPERVEPFKRWYFQDKNGYNGKLKAASPVFKARFKAKFFQDAGGELMGAWWTVPASVDLDEFYEIVA